MTPRSALRFASRWASGCALAIAVVGASVGCRRIDDDPPRPRTIASNSTPRPSPSVPESGSNNTTVVVPDFARVADRLGPSVVTVISTVRDRNARRNKVVRGVGSGMLVSAAGQVLTNEHVVATATRVDVELSNRQRYEARVLVAEPMLDLALLELQGELPELDPVEFSDRTPRPGEWVMAIGQPFGLGHTVTVGVISGLGRDYDDLGRPDGLAPTGIWSFIQTDASINIGNSGGPLVDADGAVVGITTAVRSDGQGLAFAIPAPMARRFLDESWRFGRIRLARLGISASNASLESVPSRSAVQVTQVDPAGPAAKAQVEEGDYLLAMNGRPIHRVSDVAYLTQLAGVGAKVLVTIARGSNAPEQVQLIPAEIRG